MKQKNIIIFLVFLASKLFALPEGNEVISGKADFISSDTQTMRVVTSDKTIINYQKFDIDSNERVEFIQPSEKSCVLNRVTGKNVSQILGEMKSNGKVFLVNPQGIYFGKDAIVNTNSFVASTLNIKDEDFLTDSLKFFLEPESENSKIINEGKISVADSGFISLFSPIIENRGLILAKAGKVALASAEKVTIDFSQDGLVQFVVDGDLEQALIENYGKIVSASGDVLISLNAAKRAVKMVVNTDGIVSANSIEEQNGVFRLVNQGSVEGGKVVVDSSVIESNGKIESKGDLLLSADEAIVLNGSSLIAGNDLRSCLKTF